MPNTTCVETVTEEKLTAIPQARSVRWAPLRGIPLERRLQMLAVCTWISLLFICLVTFSVCFAFPILWPLLIAYAIFLFHDTAPESGGRRFDCTRRWAIWRYFANYFPVKLIKEHDLDSTSNYIFGYHPHGIISMGAFANFATEATGFSELFPGIIPSLLTLVSNFRLPLYRDIILALGMGAVSRSSCEAILNSGPGRACVIVVGGASESLNARPGIADLTLRKRLGFIRLAIKNQASLVPVFSFGENELYEQFENSEGSVLWSVQKKMQSLLGFTIPLFHARGIFNYDVGFVPFRHPIVTVVGRPVPVPKLAKDQVEPTKEQVLAVQEAYIDGLKAIYDKYKDVYAKDRKQDLRLID
ncbi:diacylglycerol acyltransferase [Radiomyces spectabilis]|uniref:diacylglycerol acyltransferase n=1 Tax=Radiomyces spectabilis TaxID=64574 RepID=UPI0022202C9A|nr:diacylglycerol acyltransferase [Radiomyces spectabilis]KAI8393320.1 diacylglycerol acyltransferase [Radiomyces spectabilis]